MKSYRIRKSSSYDNRFDENQEMAIDTSMTELENLADENDKDSQVQECWRKILRELLER